MKLRESCIGALLFSLIFLNARAADVGWPREYDQAENRVILHQPQVDSWDDYKSMNFRAAVEIAPKAGGKSSYGVVDVDVDTAVNLSDRTVVLSAFKVKEIRFPNVKDTDEARLVDIAKATLPLTADRAIEVSLDRILAEMEKPKTQRAVSVSMKAPQIFYSDAPAILVNFIGKPQFKPVAGTKLMAAINTNWDVFLDTSTSTYFMLNGTSWLTSKGLESGAWKFAKELPTDFLKLPKDPNWEDVQKNIPGKSEGKEPQVFLSNEPAELIVTEGEPVFTPIPKTSLMDITNTDSVTFFHTAEKQFYLQVAGRWFRSKKLEGPWAGASDDLPADFAQIPDDNENAFIKASVPGTDECKDAVLLASIPQKTAINKADAKCIVEYDGAPRFVEVKQTTIKYAINSPNDVFLVDKQYYSCFQGMWFESNSATGPWTLCTVVPQVLYTIPEDHPKHNVTYVYVYDSTPTTVYVGYTSGYCGEYVARNGVLMFGMGMLVGAALANDWDDDCWHWHYSYGCHSHYYGWGCGAIYHHGYGGYYRGAVHYGPYGGAGRIGYYNPSTGGWARGGYMYGPAGGAFAREGYNPFTDTYFAQAGVKTPLGSSGRFYAERGNNSVWGGHESRGPRSVAWAEADNGAKIVHGDTLKGQGTIAKDKDGNIYVGKDGNIYKRDAEGGWSQNNRGDWESVNKPKTTSARDDKPEPKASSLDASKSSRFKDSSDRSQQLDFDAKARNRGTTNSQRASSAIDGDRSKRSGGRGGRR